MFGPICVEEHINVSLIQESILKQMSSSYLTDSYAITFEQLFIQVVDRFDCV